MKNIETALVISTSPQRGNIFVGDFGSVGEALQSAYDHMVTEPGLPHTLMLDPSNGPFEMDAPLEVWQSQTRVTSTGGLALVPAPGYTGPLLTTGLRETTRPGEDGLLSNVTIDHLHLDGRHQSKGIVLRHVQLSNFHDLHVRNTHGAALRLSDFCIENLFANLILSDRTGNDDEPTLWIEPENTGILPIGGATQDLGNITVNSTYFSGVMIHFPNNDALRISSGGAPVELSRRHRKIQFDGCFFHAHGGIKRPLVTLEDCFEIAFLGCQMLCWSQNGTVLAMGAERSAFPVGATMISHCHILGMPGEDLTSVGIDLRNVEKGTGVLAAFGNNFGSHDGRLGHAVNWGDSPGVQASWAANLVHTQKAPFLGREPANADVSPFT